MKITRDNNNALVESDGMAFTYTALDNPRDLEELRTKEDSFKWDDYGIWSFDRYFIHPFGTHNDVPEKIRGIIQANYIAPGLLTKKKLLLWGKGPKLYKEKINELNEFIKEWKGEDDDEVKDIYRWLQSWDYEVYLDQCVTSFQYMEGVFSKSIRNKGGRIGTPFINKLEHVGHDKCRLATEIDSGASVITNKYRTPTHAITTDFSLNSIDSLMNYTVYNLFDKSSPFKHAQSICYSKLSTFLQDIYTLPDIYGTLEWIKRSTAIPLIIKALNKNSINLKFHVESPQAYWDALEDKLKSECTEINETYTPKLLKEKELEIFDTITKVLGGEENTGKLWHTKKVIMVDGSNLMELGWTIKPIDQNIKDFVDSLLKIASKADHALAAAINMHSSLGGVSESGKSDSGSEQLYAYMIYLAVANDLPEMIITKHLNEVIKANFNTNYKVGFYHEKPQRQQDVSSKDRIENKV